MELPVAPSELVAGLLAEGVEELGERLVRAFLTLYDEPAAREPFLALLRGAVSHERAATLLREFVDREVLGRLAAAASPDAPELRASLAGSQIVGLAMARYVVGVAPLRTAERETLVAAVGPAVQRYLTGPITPG
jgi:hypothetical protein